MYKPLRDLAFDSACAFARLREIQPVLEPHHRLDRLRRAIRLHDVPPLVRRLIVGVIGGTVLLIGIALMVLPGPAFVVIPLGLAILATEFVWARRWLQKARSLVTVGKKPARQPSSPSSASETGRKP